MPRYAAECFNAGLYSLLTAALREDVTGYQSFRDLADHSWGVLADRPLISALLAGGLTDEEITDGLLRYFPKVLESGFGETGKALYECGFWCGHIQIGLMSDADRGTIDESVRKLKYSCAHAGRPQPLHEFVIDCENPDADLDMVDTVASYEDIYLWIVAYVDMERRRSLRDVVLLAMAENVPFGNVLKAIFER